MSETRKKATRPENLTKKIISAHLTGSASLIPGEEIALIVDQTLTHDVNAVMGYLAFEQLDVERVKTSVSVSYLDHNLLYIDNKTPDDHMFIKSFSKRYGLWTSRPGNGIMHSLHCSRFAVPGETCLGTDSHTPSSGAVGMLSIGGGGTDVALAMAGMPIHFVMPEVVNVKLSGALRPGAAPKDVILELLRRIGVKGGMGKVFEYSGPGVETLEVSDRITIANMGAEAGATTSIFPADRVVKAFYRAQEREEQFVEMLPDEGCKYDSVIEIDLDSIEPLIACPDQPDNVTEIRNCPSKKVDQVFIGSCTNGSYKDIAKAALVMKGHHVHEDVSCVCGIASRQIYKQLLKDGYLEMLINAGVRLLEISCGPCCGIGQVPPTNGVSVRTSNRNFKGRSGNKTAEVYLTSTESAAAIAVKGVITTAEELMGENIHELEIVKEPEAYDVDDSLLIPPLGPEEAGNTIIKRGSNIKALPLADPPEQSLLSYISLKAGDNITTDDITPASAELSSMRSNIPLMSQYCFRNYDPSFSERASALESSIIVAGENYGQGSSREHAAIVPMFLGIKAVIAKSIARIHRNNLINHGVIPILFADKADYERLEQGDLLKISGLIEGLKKGRLMIHNTSKGHSFEGILELSGEEKEVLIHGGRINYYRYLIQNRGKES